MVTTTTDVTTATEGKVVKLLNTVQRPGIGKLIDYLRDKGFFAAPASSRFHGSYVGGLAAHSLRVYELLEEAVADFGLTKKVHFGQMPMKVSKGNLVIAALLHDLCKIGAYQRTKKDDGWTNNRDKEKGHAKLSISRIKEFIELEKIEEMMIRFHMGLYGCIEFQDKEGDPNGEYHLRGDHSKDESMTKEESQKARYGKSLANATFHNPVCKMISICDQIATFEELVKIAV